MGKFCELVRLAYALGSEAVSRVWTDSFRYFLLLSSAGLFQTDASKQTVETGLEWVRRSFQLYIYGYVVMPENVYLLLSEPQSETLVDALKSLRQGVSLVHRQCGAL